SNVRGRYRSFSAECFRSFADIDGVRLYSLQKQADKQQLALALPGERVVDLDEQIVDFQDSAAIMANLDLVITCDSAPAHLAGALGVPVWLALSFVPDWRWFLDREDSPWYPTMRLFRQRKLGDWAELFERMELALREQLAFRTA